MQVWELQNISMNLSVGLARRRYPLQGLKYTSDYIQIKGKK